MILRKVEMQFQEEDASAKEATTTPQVNENQNNNPTAETPEDNFSFPSSTFNHLNGSDGSDSFLSLYDKAGGPPKPPRKNDSSFTGGPSGVTNVTFADEIQDDEQRDVHI